MMIKVFVELKLLIHSYTLQIIHKHCLNPDNKGRLFKIIHNSQLCVNIPYYYSKSVNRFTLFIIFTPTIRSQVICNLTL